MEAALLVAAVEQTQGAADGEVVAASVAVLDAVVDAVTVGVAVKAAFLGVYAGDLEAGAWGAACQEAEA